MATNEANTEPIGFAHRGARAHAPENTMAAFLKAIELGADSLETDMWLSADGVVIIDHDGVVGNGLRRTRIGTLLDDEIPSSFLRLTEFQERIGANIRLSIDVKDPGAAREIVRIRGQAGPVALANTYLCDTDPMRLSSWRQFDEHIHLVASMRRRALRSWPPQRLAQLDIGVINLPHRQWSGALVAKTHAAGLHAFAWGVQRPRRMRRLLSWGIDGIFSDHSDRMVAALRANQSDSTAKSAQTHAQQSSIR